LIPLASEPNNLGQVRITVVEGVNLDNVPDMTSEDFEDSDISLTFDQELVDSFNITVQIVIRNEGRQEMIVLEGL
jgi:hypothetical protein